MRTSFWTSLFDLIVPRRCAICSNRLAPEESLLCADCEAELEKTPFHESPYDNPMARLFWGQFPIEKASAWFYYRPHSDPSKMIYDLKYHGQLLLGEDIGEQLALRHLPTGFFNDIDAIVPIPITCKRQRERGYNQSMQVARGICQVTHLPIFDKVIKRQHFSESQTHQSSTWERRENVRDAFQLIDADKIKGKHLLIIDDIVTTGATFIACGQELAKAEGVKLSVLSIGYTKE